MANKIIMGFDISSSCTGWCALKLDTETNELSHWKSGFYKPIKSKDLIERLAKTQEDVKKIIEIHSPDYIGIEDIIEFIRGKSSAKTILTLSNFNRSIGLTCRQYLGHSPSFFSVLSIRHGLKLTKEFPKKEEVPDLINHHLKMDLIGLHGPAGLYKRGSTSVPRTEFYDIADGCAVATYYGLVLTGKVKKPKSK
jgi:Holliday junction resolvasome RuvABC endonuclease subunit